MVSASQGKGSLPACQAVSVSHMLVNPAMTLEQELAAIEAGLRAPNRRKAGQAVSESAVQRAIIKALNAHGLLCMHVPNAGKRGLGAAMALKRDGMTTGWPDLAVYASEARHCLFEVKPPHWKAPRSGEALHQWNQRLRLYDAIRSRGTPVEVVQSIDDALRHLRRWGWVR